MVGAVAPSVYQATIAYRKILFPWHNYLFTLILQHITSYNSTILHENMKLISSSKENLWLVIGTA